MTGLLQKYNALNQTYGETKALWEKQTMRLHEETARSQLMAENESRAQSAMDAQVTRVEAKRAAETEDLRVKLRAAEERAEAAEIAMREARDLMTGGDPAAGGGLPPADDRRRAFARVSDDRWTRGRWMFERATVPAPRLLRVFFASSSRRLRA